MKYKNRPRQLFTILVLLLLWLTTVANAQITEYIRQSTLGSMVVIQTEFGTRSGFYVASDLIATNYHVVYRAQSIAARNFKTNGYIQVYGAVAIDPHRDLVILKVASPNYSYLRPIYSPSESKGYVVGNQDKGAGKGRIFKDAAGNSDEFLIATWVAPNSSGGPVLNESGEVIGILVRGVISPDPKLHIPVGWAVDGKYLGNLVESAKSERIYRFPVPEYQLNSWNSISRANMMFENGTSMLQEAIEVYNEALNSDSEFAVYLNRAMAKYRFRKLAGALDDLHRATGTSTFKKVLKVAPVIHNAIKLAKSFIKLKY